MSSIAFERQTAQTFPGSRGSQAKTPAGSTSPLIQQSSMDPIIIPSDTESNMSDSDIGNDETIRQIASKEDEDEMESASSPPPLKELIAPGRTMSEYDSRSLSKSLG